ncbi:hypothetical protein [Longimicrobium sp.]|uniref:hypothetical protein n=1 Tax=Longimicrobium sp. TaxID=2029185 RepID=UPI003B3AED7C
MSVKTYYRWALLLPLLVPALAWLLQGLLPGSAAAMAYLLFMSVVIGGVPYLLFAIGFLLWMRGASDARVHRGILLAPLTYTVVLVICLTLFLLVDGTLSNSSDSLGTFVGFALVFGYGYVALAELGRALLRPGTAPAEPVPAV